MQSDYPFIDQYTYSQQFTSGLKDILQADTLGAYILVLANAIQSHSLWGEMREQLVSKRSYLQQLYATQLQAEDENDTINPDDLNIFRQIVNFDLNNMPLAQFRQAGPWLLQNNIMRRLRPQRMSARIPDQLYIDFNPNGFHFNKPFMEAEKLWQGDLSGLDVSLYYNKFPFVEHHLLLVPERAKQYPQYHRQENHSVIWELASASRGWQSSFGIAYNSTGAFASVNHLHYQVYLRKDKFAIEAQRWQHNGGNDKYPLKCQRFNNIDRAWQAIDLLQRQNQPFNLLYRPQNLFIISRKLQGTYDSASWCSNFAWYEACGALLIDSEDDFNAVDERDIETEMHQLHI